MTLLWLKWSWRDMRARWLQIAAIALVIALGTGSYAGLTSLTDWRRASSDTSYEQLRMHHLRVELPAGASAGEGDLARIVEGALGDDLDAVEERLLLDIQVDASQPDQAVLVPGRLIGSSFATGAEVNRVHVQEGRPLEPGDAGQPVVLLEYNFARHYDLPPEGNVTLGGGRDLRYVGQVLAPEYFIVTTERGGLLAEANFAVAFTSLETAQEIAGQPGRVNDAVLTLVDDAGTEAARDRLDGALRDALPSQSFTVTTRAEDPSFGLNDRDIDGDQQLFQIFSVLIFAGAVVAAFNLITRVVESQRREIGIGMVLGVPPQRIAIRPLLLAAEIALLGVILGVVVGLVLGNALASVLEDFLPLPTLDTSFRPGIFAVVAVLGFLLPFLATLWPVWRAVSVLPVQAIRPAYRAVQRGGAASLLRRIRIPGSTFAQMPFRNLIRAPRRSFLTGLGIAAAIAALVAFVGLIDSFLGTIERAEDEIVADEPDRLEVELFNFYPVDSSAVGAIAGDEHVGQSLPAARVDAIAVAGPEQVNLQLDVMPLDNELWTPTISEGELDRDTPGLYLSELAARNLGVGPGDTVTLRHPRLDAEGTVAFAETELPVLGEHPHPFRFVAYIDSRHAGLFGIEGLANLVQVVPADGATRDDVKRALFPLEGVSSTQGVNEVAEAIDDLLSEFVVVLRVVEGAMLLLALLIAFNSASINMDERSREHATMFAFGVPVRTVLRMAIVENLLLGVVATTVGIIAGWYMLRAIIAIRIPDTVPDLDVLPTLSPTTVIVALALGVLAVALAPLLTWRRLARMNVPSTLKAAE